MHCWDLDVRINYWIELNWQASRQQRCRDACQISERYDHYNIQSRGFKTSRSCDNMSYRLVSRGPISQIPEYIRQKSDNAPFCNRNVHISVTKCCIVGYGIDAFWDLWDGSIVQPQHKIHGLFQLCTSIMSINDWGKGCIHSKNKVVKWTTLALSNWCQKRTPQSRPKLVIWMSGRMTILMSSQKQPESRQMTTF